MFCTARSYFFLQCLHLLVLCSFDVCSLQIFASSATLCFCLPFALSVLASIRWVQLCFVSASSIRLSAVSNNWLASISNNFYFVLLVVISSCSLCMFLFCVFVQEYMTPGASYPARIKHFLWNWRLVYFIVHSWYI